MKNSKNLSCLLSYIVEDLYEYSVFFVIYFCILLFFKFNKKNRIYSLYNKKS
ncbi:hypothetical protein [Fusobacterium nucleatum]|uniref:hypothetical protein n=1 Tax=Fusobacterium nucleatum TaxID=851 RepID=UPI0023622D25|nr:hypothetical protein [Fusobacterium nucleatum]WDD88461.1 hypothetical protein PSR68_08675 [Fusobacterium nucleatum]